MMTLLQFSCNSDVVVGGCENVFINAAILTGSLHVVLFKKTLLQSE